MKVVGKPLRKFMFRWDELTHRSVRAYHFRQRYVMAPFKRLTSKMPWHDEAAVAKFHVARSALWRQYLTDSTVLEVGCGAGGGGIGVKIRIALKKLLE